MSTTIMDDLKILGEQLERLQIENRLLRAASEEQRGLNGSLREEYNELQNKYNLIFKQSLTAHRNWANWFDTWAIMLDGSCYDDAYDYYCQSRDILESTEGNVKTNAVTATTEEWDCQP